MRLKTQRKVVYAAMGVAVFAMLGGYALAQVGLGGTSTTQQGSETTSIGTVAGLDWDSTQLVMLESAPAGGACNTGAGCDVSSAGASTCAGGLAAGHTVCAASDFVEQVTLSTETTTAFAGEVNITVIVVVSGTPHTGITLNYTETGTPAATTYIVIDFDITLAGGAPAQVTSVTEIAQVE